MTRVKSWRCKGFPGFGSHRSAPRHVRCLQREPATGWTTGLQVRQRVRPANGAAASGSRGVDAPSGPGFVTPAIAVCVFLERHGGWATRVACRARRVSLRARRRVSKVRISELSTGVFSGKEKDMNAAISHYDDQEFRYRAREIRTTLSRPSHSRRSRHSARRRGKSPVQFNGIHRRRHKKITW